MDGIRWKKSLWICGFDKSGNVIGMVKKHFTGVVYLFERLHRGVRNLCSLSQCSLSNG